MQQFYRKSEPAKLMEVVKKYLCDKGKPQPKKASNNDQNKSKEKKVRRESTRAIFGLPNAVINKFHRQNQQKFNQTILGFCKLRDQGGISARQYHDYLGKTILNHTKVIFEPSNHQISLPESKFQPMGIKSSMKKSLYILNSKKSLDSSAKTLKILEKVILKGSGYVEREQDQIQLSANRLPIIKRKQSKRKQSLSVFDSRHYGYLPSSRKIDGKSPKLQRKQRIQIKPWDIFQASPLYE